MLDEQIVMVPIGTVNHGIPKNANKAKCADFISQLVILPALQKALDGIEEYSHIIVLFWMHKAGSGHPLEVQPYGMQDIEPKGVLATRMPQRPNPLGMTIVNLIGRTGNILWVRGLDAFSGTPILDIKPYTGHPRDLIYSYTIPEWEKSNYARKGEGERVPAGNFFFKKFLALFTRKPL